jgi:hypothetical protein
MEKLESHMTYLASSHVLRSWPGLRLSKYAKAMPAFPSSQRGSRDETHVEVAHQAEETTVILDGCRRLAEAESTDIMEEITLGLRNFCAYPVVIKNIFFIIQE